MAVLEKIRTKMGILASLIIGLSLLAFILTDALSSGKSVFSGSLTTIAEINGESVDIKEFEQRITKLEDIYKFQSGQTTINEEVRQNLRDETWKTVVDDYVMEKEYNELGLEVTGKEVLDLVQGANPHQIFRQVFQNPETKEYDGARVLQYIKSLEKEQDPNKKAFVLYIEQMVLKDRITTKFNNLIKKGLYVTSEQVLAETKNNNKKVNFNFTGYKVSSISDSAVIPKESDYKEYYKKHKNEFEQEASRDIEYITYDINPSNDDFEQAQNWIKNAGSEFKTTPEIKQYVSMNSDAPFNEKYLKQSELPDSIKDFMFKAKLGDSYGPYFENSSYKIARLSDIKDLPDSVRARHILIRPKAETAEALKSAENLADSLKTVLKKGDDFAKLAKAYSTDGSASKGGDLGWFKEGAMVKPFNDACFFGKKGDITVVKSQFGIHVIEITDRGKEVKKVQIGILERKVEASSATLQFIYQKASTFLGTNNTGAKFQAAVKKQAMTPVAVNVNETMKEIAGLENSRELIRWAFNAKPDAMTDVKQYGNKFVIAHLLHVKEKGIAPIDQVLTQIEPSVKKEKKLDILFDRLKSEMTGTKTIEELASKAKETVLTASDINLNSYAVPNAGFEPKLVATAVASAPEKLIGPIRGNNGVYALVVTSVGEKEGVDAQMLKMRLASMYDNRVNYEALKILTKLADVKDKRINFY
jgi:peptidyl-prolyl cis-trans isomerase D